MDEIQRTLASRFAGTFFGEPGEALELAIPIDSATQSVLDRLIRAGLRPLIAGGAVRDTILGKQPKDFDIEVHGAQSFGELRSVLNGLGTLNLAGKDFGVLKLRVRGADGAFSEEIDLSLPRRDSKTGDGHRGFTIEVDPQMSLLEATARRDLTVNALMWDPKSSLVIDLHGGLADLEAGTLRHVSEAFSEDPLRVLRVARFAAKLGFTVDPATVELCRSLRESFSELPPSRITGELGKMILEPYPFPGFSFLGASGWAEPLGFTGGVDDGLSWDLGRGLINGEDYEGFGSPSSRRVIQLAIMAARASEVVDREMLLSHFAVTKAELKRALAVADAPSAVAQETAQEVRQWAWDNAPITAREKITLEEALEAIDYPEYGWAFERFEEFGVLDGAEADRFDSKAVISEHRAANPELKDGPWIKALLQKHRAVQYGR